MDDARYELNKAHERAERLRRVEAQLAKLKADVAALSHRQTALANQLVKENADVAMLEAGSVSGAFLKLVGAYKGQLDRERAESLAAALRHEAATRALAEARLRITELEEERDLLEGSKEAYQALFIRRVQALESGSGESGRRILELTEEIGRSKANLREISEAISAGNFAVQQLDVVADNLLTREFWAPPIRFRRFRMLQNLRNLRALRDDAEIAANAARHPMIALSRFNAELADVSVTPFADAGMVRGMRYADALSKGLVEDWLAQHGARKSMESVITTRAEVQSAMIKLRILSQREKEWLNALEEEMRRLVLGA